MASRKKEDVPGFVRWSKVDKGRKKALLGRRNIDEHVLTTIDNASASVEIGSLMPATDAATGKRHIFKVVRVDRDLDAVYGVIVPKLPMPWWKWNNEWRKGLVTEAELDEFNLTTSG